MQAYHNTSHQMVAALKLYRSALEEHAPTRVYIAFSGGRDSAVVLDLFARYHREHPHADRLPPLAVMVIDTGLAADRWLAWTIEYCAPYRLRVDVAHGHGRDWYAANVAAHGFGYTPGQHAVYYRMLKQRAIERHLQSVKTGWRDRVLYLTGVRRAESLKRRSARPTYRHGARVTLNPLIDWQNAEVHAYHSRLLPFYDNPFYARYGASGDCFCGWTCANRVTDFSDSPRLQKFLCSLDSDARKSHGYGYGERPDRLDASPQSATMPEDSLCANCTQRALPGFLV